MQCISIIDVYLYFFFLILGAACLWLNGLNKLHNLFSQPYKGVRLWLNQSTGDLFGQPEYMCCLHSTQYFPRVPSFFALKFVQLPQRHASFTFYFLHRHRSSFHPSSLPVFQPSSSPVFIFQCLVWCSGVDLPTLLSKKPTPQEISLNRSGVVATMEV